jgi:hypothetical protein
MLLVFDGIKMGATVAFNGHVLGNATNQHRRWVYSIKPSQLELVEGATQAVTVTFDATISTEGRYMDCSGGWVRCAFFWQKSSLEDAHHLLPLPP